MMGAIHQMERELPAERPAGRASAKASGKTAGRPRTDVVKLRDPKGKTADEVCKVVGGAAEGSSLPTSPCSKISPHRQLDLFDALGKNSLGRISPWAIRSASQAASLASVLRPGTFLTWAALAKTSANSRSDRMCHTGFQ
jgi:hypothetical protein